MKIAKLPRYIFVAIKSSLCSHIIEVNQIWESSYPFLKWQWIFSVLRIDCFCPVSTITLLANLTMSNMPGVLYETGSAYYPRATGFTLFLGRFGVAHLFSLQCCISVLSLFCVLCPCCLCLLIVHSGFPRRFSLTYTFTHYMLLIICISVNQNKCAYM